jgi:hypothetical protein
MSSQHPAGIGIGIKGDSRSEVKANFPKEPVASSRHWKRNKG